MRWFLERITAKHLPINFGSASKREHPDDFSKLVTAGVVKRADMLTEVECKECHDDRLWQVREDGGDIFYICQSGCGKIALTDDDVAIFHYDNAAFLKLIAKEFGIKTNNDTFTDETAYSENSLYDVGTYECERVSAEVYYLRTDEAHEPSSVFDHLGNGTKVLITNTVKPILVWGKGGTHYCVLANTLAAPSSKHIFDAVKFKKCLESVRRVRFDEKQGNLFLDENRVYTAALKSPEYYFLAYLWEHWQEQVPHGSIYQSTKGARGRGVADTAQKFCNKAKSDIKKKYADIDRIVTVSTVGHYMMADPV